MENNSSSLLICPKCQTALPEGAFFCFNCGAKIKEPPVSTTILRQIWLYFLSAALPPLGLWPAVKYLKQEDPKAKLIGVVCVVLTILSIVLTLWATLGFIQTFNQTLQTQLGGSNLYLQVPGQN